MEEDELGGGGEAERRRQLAAVDHGAEIGVEPRYSIASARPPRVGVDADGGAAARVAGEGERLRERRGAAVRRRAEHDEAVGRGAERGGDGGDARGEGVGARRPLAPRRRAARAERRVELGGLPASSRRPSRGRAPRRAPRRPKRRLAIGARGGAAERTRAAPPAAAGSSTTSNGNSESTLAARAARSAWARRARRAEAREAGAAAAARRRARAPSPASRASPPPPAQHRHRLDHRLLGAHDRIELGLQRRRRLARRERRRRRVVAALDVDANALPRGEAHAHDERAAAGGDGEVEDEGAAVDLVAARRREEERREHNLRPQRRRHVRAEVGEGTQPNVERRHIAVEDRAEQRSPRRSVAPSLCLSSHASTSRTVVRSGSSTFVRLVGSDTWRSTRPIGPSEPGAAAAGAGAGGGAVAASVR